MIVIFVKYAKFLPHIYKVINNLIGVFNLAMTNLNIDLNIKNIEMNHGVEHQLETLDQKELMVKLQDESDKELNNIMVIVK